MDLSHQYHFGDFTRAAYRDCLELAKQHYRFRSFDDFSREEKFVLWRHDLDFSVHAARRLAQIEQEAGVTATYFLLPHSDFYNLFEKEVSDLVRNIATLGHRIGLHFDTHYYGISNEEQLEEKLHQEARWLKELFGVEVTVFSFHNTTEFTMSCQNWQYGGLINTYAEYFQKEVGYCSDSHGIWRFRRLKEVLEKAEDPRLQVLTHPEWWLEEAMAPRRRVVRAIEGRAAKVLSQYDALLERISRPNIDQP